MKSKTKKLTPASIAKDMQALKIENDLLRQAIYDFHWTARRYCDNRQSYVTGSFNSHVRALIKAGINLLPCDGTLWARDQQGRAYDGLTEAEATPGTPEARGEKRPPVKMECDEVSDCSNGCDKCAKTPGESNG